MKLCTTWIFYKKKVTFNTQILGGNPCGTNETFVPCKVNCPSDYCPVNNSPNRVICETPNPCYPGCVCKINYRRRSIKEPRCMYASECRKFYIELICIYQQTTKIPRSSGLIYCLRWRKALWAKLHTPEKKFNSVSHDLSLYWDLGGLRPKPCHSVRLMPCSGIYLGWTCMSRHSKFFFHVIMN